MYDDDSSYPQLNIFTANCMLSNIGCIIIKRDSAILIPIYYKLYFLVFFFRKPTMDVRPNHTIYINNLNEKIKKDGK